MKGRILLLLGVGVVVPTSAYFAMGGESPLPSTKNIEADPEGYSMVFNASKRLNGGEASATPAEVKAKTSSGNDIYFTYQNVGVGGEGVFQTLEPGGYFQNSFKPELEFNNRISGINGVSFTVGTPGALKIYFGDRYLDGILWDNGRELNEMDISLGYTQEYFKVVNTSGSAVDLTSFTLRYSCAPSEGSVGYLLTYSGNSVTGVTVDNTHSMDIVIPSRYEENDITQIAGSAFNNYTKLWNCYLPEGFKAIRTSAFNTCTGLTYLFIPIDVADVYGSAFANCGNINLYCARASDAKPSWYTGWNNGVKSVTWNASRYNLPVD